MDSGQILSCQSEQKCQKAFVINVGREKVFSKVFAGSFLINLGELREQLHARISIQYLLSIHWKIIWLWANVYSGAWQSSQGLQPPLADGRAKAKAMRRGTCLLAESEGSLAWKERLMRSIQEGWEGDELVEREAEVGSRFKNADLATAARFPVPRLWLVRPAVFPNHWLVRGEGGNCYLFVSFLSPFQTAALIIFEDLLMLR